MVLPGAPAGEEEAMTFAADPAVLRVEAALGCERKAARAVVRALVTVAPRAMPWIDAEDVEVTTGRLFAGEPLLGALVRARLVEETAAGIVLTSEGERLRESLDEERAAAAERKRASREMKEVVTFCDQRVTSRDIGVTFRSAAGQVSSAYGDPDGTNRDAEGVASQITRVAGARGNLLPPTPPAASGDSAPASTLADLPDPEAWLHEVAKRRGWRLDRVQRRELLGHMQAGMSPDFLESLLNQAADNDQRRMVWIRPALRREMERMAVRSPPGVEELEFEQGGICHEAGKDDPDGGAEGQVPDVWSRAGEDVPGGAQQATGVVPPGAPSAGDGCVLPAGRRGLTDPIPIGEARLLREHRESEGEYEW